MKLSQFNIVALGNENNYIIYNTHTTACVSLDEENYKLITDNINSVDRNIINALYENGIVVDDSVDEVGRIEKIRENVMTKSIQNIVIFTTTECNARCYYCFEKGIKPTVLTESTADAIIEFCKKYYKNKQIAISWFGGEPLLNFEIIKYISDKLISLGYELEAHITTNGSLLTYEMVDYFEKNYANFSFQITVDALYDDYANIKRYVDIEPQYAFDRTINNIKMLIKRNVELIIRVNFAASKIEKAKEIYKMLISIFADYDLSKVYIYLAPLTLDGDKEIISNFHGDMEHPFLQVVRTQKEEGFPLQKLRSTGELSLLATYSLTPTAIPCGMTLHSRIVVNADGELYKCHRLAGKDGYSVGNVYNGFYDNNKILEFYYNPEVTDEECRKCNILPICQEGCKYMRLIYGDKQKCNRIKQVKEEYYYAMKNK